MARKPGSQQITECDCKYCDKTFPYKGWQVRHYKIVHGMEL